MYTKATLYSMSIPHHLTSMEYDHSTGQLFAVNTGNVTLDLIRIAIKDDEIRHEIPAGTTYTITEVQRLQQQH